MTMVASDATARRLLILVWFGFFLGTMSVVLYLYLVQAIERDNFIAALEQLNGLYAPYVGAITLFYWGGAARKASTHSQAGTAFALALLSSLIWNGLLFFFIVPLVFQSGFIEDSMANVTKVGGLLSWLVAGAIGYYFANPTGRAVPQDNVGGVT